MKIIRSTVAKQLLCALTFAALTNLYGAGPVAVVVPGTSDPWLAGMPNGAPASGGDFAPGQSPVQVTGLTLTPGMPLSITATGLVGQDPDSIFLAGPDGTLDPPHNHDAGAENGISDITARFSSLVGVFLNAAQPNLTPAPLPAADPSHPDLKQVFLIGSSAIVTVPAGATRLFLGTMDSFQWWNNVGAFTAQVTAALYNICLLYDPTKPVNSGATIPIKLQLCDSAGANLSSAGITVHAVSLIQVSTSSSGLVQDSGQANPDSDFRFEGGAGRYIFNLSTKGLSSGTYQLNFTTSSDLFPYSVLFQVK